MMYSTKIMLGLVLTIAFSSCRKVSVNAIKDKDPHVYLAGSVWDDANKKYKAFLKKDDELSFLNSSEESASVLAMAVEGTDIYLSGYAKKPTDKGQIACYWKNGARTSIEKDYDFGSSALDIAVAGGVVYTCGFKSGPAVYWRNTTSYSAEKSLSGRDTYTSITVSNNDVYIGGYYTDPVTFKSVPTYWKNDKLFSLPTPAGHYGFVNDIALKGSDIYAVGYTLEADGKNGVATYWKNGVATKLGDGSNSTVIYAIVIAGDDVYMAGTIDQKTMVCWKNDKVLFKDETTTSVSTGVRDIYIYKNDVYLAGSIYITNTISKPVYWKNQELHNINDAALSGGTVNGIAVLPQL